MPLWLKFVDAMAEGQPDAPKKPADLRYVKLTSTGWTQPVSLYLLERIEGDRVWLVCRPALDAPQEDLPTFQVAGEEEKICFEHVDFSALNPGDECYYFMGRAFAPEQVRVMEVHDQPDSPYPHLLRKRFTVDFLVYCKQEPGSMVPCECARECGEWVCPGKPQGIPFRTNILYMLSLDAGDQLMLEIAREYFPGDGGDLL